MKNPNQRSKDSRTFSPEILEGSHKREMPSQSKTIGNPGIQGLCNASNYNVEGLHIDHNPVESTSQRIKYSAL